MFYSLTSFCEATDIWKLINTISYMNGFVSYLNPVSTNNAMKMTKKTYFCHAFMFFMVQ